jgi:hypothetical protein
MEKLTNNIEHETDEPVVGCQGQQNAINQQDVLKVIDDALSIEEVHGRSQEIPVQRLGEAQTPGPTRNVGNGNNLLEGYDLDGSDNNDNVDMAGEHGDEEAADHD